MRRQRCTRTVRPPRRSAVKKSRVCRRPYQCSRPLIVRPALRRARFGQVGQIASAAPRYKSLRHNDLWSAETFCPQRLENFFPRVVKNCCCVLGLGGRTIGRSDGERLKLLAVLPSYLNALSPVTDCPRINEWTSCVPSYV